MSATFQMSEKERASILAWVKSHNSERHGGKYPYAGAAGGGLTYEFTPTGLGQAIWVRCMCGEKHEATDFDDWG